MRQIHKIFPLPEEAADSTATDEPRTPTVGCGFFVTQDIVLTSHQVVDGADSIRVRHGGETIVATVLSSDPRNGIALLALDETARLSTIIPFLFGNVGEAVEGSQTVFCGFISPTFSRLSVDEGIIKSLAGPNDDLTGFTISASIGPYATGGPLLDANNRVIGIAMPTDTTGVSPTHTAVKADLLASLLRVSDIRLSEPPETEDEPLDVALGAQMARSAVVLVEAK